MQLYNAALTKKLLGVLSAFALVGLSTPAWAAAAPPAATPAQKYPAPIPTVPHTPPVPGQSWGAPGGPHGPGLPYIPT
jgi:hypothetical protein